MDTFLVPKTLIKTDFEHFPEPILKKGKLQVTVAPAGSEYYNYFCNHCGKILFGQRFTVSVFCKSRLTAHPDLFIHVGYFCEEHANLIKASDHVKPKVTKKSQNQKKNNTAKSVGRVSKVRRTPARKTGVSSRKPR